MQVGKHDNLAEIMILLIINHLQILVILSRGNLEASKSGLVTSISILFFLPELGFLPPPYLAQDFMLIPCSKSAL
jgi:hypothetical protein